MTDVRSLNLLLVEDDTLICMDLEETVEDLGHRVVAVASHVDRALERLSEAGAGIDCVLLDANLGGWSARPIADRLARLGIPYVVVTGLEVGNVRRMGLVGPMVAKPFRSQDIGRHLAAIAARRTGAASASGAPVLP